KYQSRGSDDRVAGERAVGINGERVSRGTDRGVCEPGRGGHARLAYIESRNVAESAGPACPGGLQINHTAVPINHGQAAAARDVGAEARPAVEVERPGGAGDGGGGSRGSCVGV